LGFVKGDRAEVHNFPSVPSVVVNAACCLVHVKLFPKSVALIPKSGARDVHYTWLCPTHMTVPQVTSYKMAVRMESEVVGGPTAQGQPVFEWGNSWPDFEHRGMPDR
jgi:hypothetical protein